jgi:Xaa-Pro aminopeptidase
MRHDPISQALFVRNRARLTELLPTGSVALVSANDILPTNADGTLVMVPNSDLFYLSGIEQEESLLLLAPGAADPSLREVLFLRQPTPHLTTWEGHKLTEERAREISGVRTVRWLPQLEGTLRFLLSTAEQVFLNLNEHGRATAEVETRERRLVTYVRERYPLHDLRRLAPLLWKLRLEKEPGEIALLKEAVRITEDGYRRVMSFVRPGVKEYEVEAEFAHEFVRQRAKFSYNPIIASGANSCILHYNENDQVCRSGDVLLLDVGASYANYNADLTRTLPISGRFTKRQRAVYDAVLRVMRASIANATVGRLHADWQKLAREMMDEELEQLGLLGKVRSGVRGGRLAKAGANRSVPRAAVKRGGVKVPSDRPFRGGKYFMHGLGHTLGLDVHDVGAMTTPFAEGWVLTVEPGIYLPEEGFGIRLENDVVVTEAGPVDLTASIPVEADEVEALMARNGRAVKRP